MNYLEAREKCDKDGKGLGIFHFTSMNDGKIHAVGACADGCPGHPNKAEACEHYLQGELDEVEFRDISEQWPKHKCEAEGCEEQAAKKVGPAFLKFQQPVLCAEHANIEEVAKIWGTGEFSFMSSLGNYLNTSSNDGVQMLDVWIGIESKEVTGRKIIFKYGWKFWRWPKVFMNRLKNERMFRVWRAAKKRGEI